MRDNLVPLGRDCPSEERQSLIGSFDGVSFSEKISE